MSMKRQTRTVWRKRRAPIFVNEDAFAAISQGTAKKGDVLGIARIAGIDGGQKTNASVDSAVSSDRNDKM